MLFDVDEVLSKMTLEEKILLMQAKDNWHLNGVARLGVPEIMLTDGPSGVRMEDNPDAAPVCSTTMPTASILSCSWDTELAEEVGAALGEESRHFKVSILLGPGVNAKRSPLGGRNFEYYSEDPYLSGRMAAAMIRGLQSQGVGSSLKHYVANDQETRRFTSDSIMDERTLREICLKPFEIAIREGHPWTIMGAYPKVNGVHACENRRLLEEILRDELGYDGVVLTDWGACVNKVDAHRNGLDLETGSFERYNDLLEAAKNGGISIECIDRHVRRILTLIRRVSQAVQGQDIDWEKQHALAIKAAEESLVLLKNENQTLPVSEGTKLAVIGALAEKPHISGGGSSATHPKKLETPLDCLKNCAAVSYAEGYSLTGTEPDDALTEEAVRCAKGADVIIAFIGTLEIMESEGSDRPDMKLPESQLRLIEALSSLNIPLVLINESGSAVDLSGVERQAAAILHAGLLGEGIGTAIAEAVFGRINPSGKLSETFPVCLENTPVYPFYPGEDDNVYYREGIFVGYRYYDTKRIPVLYPFGHGLSYTAFEYSDIRLSADRAAKEDGVMVSFDLTNTGACAGAEVVQIYIADEQSYLMRPQKELKAFQRVFLEPGETKTIRIRLNEDAFSYYVPHLHSYAVEKGRFNILVGSSSRDIRLTASLYLDSPDEVRRPLTMETPMREFLADDRYSARMNAVLKAVGLTENHPLYPVVGSIALENLPVLLEYIHIPREVSEPLRDSVLSGHQTSV